MGSTDFRSTRSPRISRAWSHDYRLRRGRSAPNANNQALARGAAKLGISAAAIRRNVKDCWNIGYCGTGCPTNAKQSMLVTTIPAALDRGATLLTRARAQAFEMDGDRVTALICVAMDARGIYPTTRRITVRARTFVAAAGAIGTPALLLRSKGARSVWHCRQAHVFAPDDRVGGADARARRWIFRRASDDLFGSFPRYLAA
jgi:choline dehydrogenase-like flavoprotein